MSSPNRLELERDQGVNNFSTLAQCGFVSIVDTEWATLNDVALSDVRVDTMTSSKRTRHKWP